MATEGMDTDMAISPEKAAGTTTGHGHATRFIFLALGLAISAWAVLVPFAKARLGVNEAELGLLLLLVGTGAIISMPFAGWLTGKYGCRKTLVVSTTVFMLSLIGLAFVSSPWAFGLSLFMFGASSGVVDVGMNIQAILVEKERKRSMMSGLHGMYSVGGFFGALIISALLNLGLTPLSAILCLTISLIAGLLIMARYLFPYGHESKNRKSFSLPKGQHSHAGCPVFHHVHGGRRRSRLGGAFHDDDQIHIGGYGRVVVRHLFGGDLDRTPFRRPARRMAWYSQGDDIKWHYRSHRLRYCDGSAVGVDRFCRFCRRRARRGKPDPAFIHDCVQTEKDAGPAGHFIRDDTGLSGSAGRTCHDGVHRPCDKPVCRFRHCRGTHDFRQCHVALAA